MTTPRSDLAAVALLFRSLADPARLAILQHLTLGEHRVVDLVAHLGLAQSTVSAHLSSQRECGLVIARAQGRASVYALARPELMDLLAAGERLLEATGDAVNAVSHVWPEHVTAVNDRHRLGRRARLPRPAVGALAVTGLVPVLLGRMRRELLRDGRLSAPTVTAMYGAYALHGLAVGVSAWRRSVPLPPRTAVVGTPLAAAGSGLVVAGMSRFVGPGQVSSTQVGELTTGGVYRLSRNPQYAGYVLALVGLGMARRSGGVVALAAGAGAVFAWWVPVEERALRRTFGLPYEHYLARTPRWLGRPQRGSGR